MTTYGERLLDRPSQTCSTERFAERGSGGGTRSGSQPNGREIPLHERLEAQDVVPVEIEEPAPELRCHRGRFLEIYLSHPLCRAVQAFRKYGLGASNHGGPVEQPIQDSASRDARGVVARLGVGAETRVDADEREDLLHHLRRIAFEVVEQEDFDLLPREGVVEALHPTVVKTFSDVAR